MQNAPFIRLLCPLITGICIQHFCPAVNLIYIFFITTICSFLFYLIPHNPAEKFRFRYTYGISICFLFCTLGMLSVALKQMQETPIPAKYIKAIARIDENNGKKIKSVSCTVTIEHIINSVKKPFSIFTRTIMPAPWYPVITSSLNKSSNLYKTSPIQKHSITLLIPKGKEYYIANICQKKTGDDLDSLPE